MFGQQHKQKEFLKWMRDTGNMFTGDEYYKRLGIWLSNKRFVQEHNSANLGFTLALNKFAHLTEAEYKSLLGFRKNMAKRKATASNFIAKDAIDWREKGIVNPVQNQGECNANWAFSAIQAQESAYALATGKLMKLSEHY